MTPARARTLLLGLLLSLVVPVLAAPPAAPAESKADPLTVRLSALRPATIPAKGKITLTGTVRNTSQHTWGEVNVAAFTSARPMSSSAEVAEAAASDPKIDVGSRLTKPGTFVAVGDLAPGDVTTFSLAVDRSQLNITGRPGVYWIGVHALGETPDGTRDLGGRARMFAPLVAQPTTTAKLAVVMPVRANVRPASDGAVADEDRWNRLLAPEGRLDRIVSLAATSGDAPFTWLIDPAVLDAAATVAAGNPRIGLGKSPDPVPDKAAAPKDEEEPDPDQANARDWLRHLTEATASEPLLGLAYADPDVSALAAYDKDLLRTAFDLAAERFNAFGLATEPAVAPPGGQLTEDALDNLPTTSTALIDPPADGNGEAGGDLEHAQYRSANGQRLVFINGEAGSGGALPTPRGDALAMRQRILSEAALNALNGDDRQLTVVLPTHWDPGTDWRSADFFRGLRQRWVRMVDLAPATGLTSYDVPPQDALGEPLGTISKIGPENVAASRALRRTGSLLEQLITGDTDVRSTLTGAGLAASSYEAEGDPEQARSSVTALSDTMDERIRSVRVTGTSFVTLSGNSGTITVGLVNDLDEPITVGVQAHTLSQEVKVTGPKPVRIGPRQRTTLRLEAKATDVGVHALTLTPTTQDGRPVGTPLEVSLRTSQVGTFVWVIMGVGFGALVLLIIRRLRARKKERTEAADG